LDYTIKDP